VDSTKLKPLKIVINSGNGAAGPTVDAINKKFIEKGVQTNFVFVHHEPDPTFPNGIPNPLLKENRSSTANAVIAEKADFGVAFDGDFDRCFFFDHSGDFIPGEYVVGLLAEVFLNKEKGATIIHDSRVIWNTIDVVGKSGGKAVASKTGHAFVKAAMKEKPRKFVSNIKGSESEFSGLENFTKTFVYSGENKFTVKKSLLFISL
jgi:phosphomannomutase